MYKNVYFYLLSEGEMNYAYGNGRPSKKDAQSVVKSAITSLISLITKNHGKKIG
jgi:hypothetical protein